MNAEPRWEGEHSLIDLLLEEQQTLTAVDVFSEFHAQDGTQSPGARYEALIPTELPGDFEQYAFRVDLDACTGCKACVTACHSLNGLDEEETWRSVGLVESMPGSDAAFIPSQQVVTTACHHCEDPACLSGCPVQAYEKDSVTGIVHHLDDQCIGCRYCQLMCPYDVPTYSKRLGIVRKCDMCRGRLSEGEAPACVQGCPNEAIQIAIVETGVAESGGQGSSPEQLMLLPLIVGAMPESKWTRPTTQYVSGKGSVASLGATDEARVEPSEGHTPLAIMLVLTQTAIGSLVLSSSSLLFGSDTDSAVTARAAWISAATLIGLAGLVASTLHLGRPQWAFRAFLGLRTSWMSREIVVFGAFAGLLVAASLSGWANWAEATGVLRGNGLEKGPLKLLSDVRPLIEVAAAGVGLLGLYCSVQIYAVTGRPLWRFARTAFRFGVTSAWMGLCLGNVALAASDARGWIVACTMTLIGLTAYRLRAEERWLRMPQTPGESIAFARTRRLLAGPLSELETRRKRLLICAGLVLPVTLLILTASGAPKFVVVGLAILILAGGLISELLERSLFFKSEAMPSMPGVG